MSRSTCSTVVDDQMLKDIGVPSAGHRLRIRNAIADAGAHIRFRSDNNIALAASEVGRRFAANAASSR